MSSTTPNSTKKKRKGRVVCDGDTCRMVYDDEEPQEAPQTDPVPDPDPSAENAGADIDAVVDEDFVRDLVGSIGLSADDVNVSDIVDSVRSGSPSASPDPSSEESAVEPPKDLSAKEKVAQLREKVRTARAKKERLEKQNREKKRKETVKLAMDVKRAHEERQVSAALNDRKKQKKADALARRRIREKMRLAQEERKERASRRAAKPSSPQSSPNASAGASTSSAPTSEPELKRRKSARDEVRVQVRCTDRSIIRNSFKVTATLAEVVQWIDANRTDGDSAYNLQSTFPARTFSRSDLETNLSQFTGGASFNLVSGNMGGTSRSGVAGLATRVFSSGSTGGGTGSRGIFGMITGFFVAIWVFIRSLNPFSFERVGPGTQGTQTRGGSGRGRTLGGSSAARPQNPPGKVTEITSAPQFDAVIRDAGLKLVVIDYYTNTCPPCKKIAPHVAQLAGDYRGRAVFYKVNVENVKTVKARQKITSWPTFQFWVRSKVVARFEGADLGRLQRLVQQHAYSPSSGASLPSRSSSSGRTGGIHRLGDLPSADNRQNRLDNGNGTLFGGDGHDSNS